MFRVGYMKKKRNKASVEKMRWIGIFLRVVARVLIFIQPVKARIIYYVKLIINKK